MTTDQTSSPLKKVARPAQKLLLDSAHALADVMGTRLAGPDSSAQAGDWYICNDRGAYWIARRLVDGSFDNPMLMPRMSASALVAALDLARLVIGMDRSGSEAIQLGYPYSGDRPVSDD